MILTHHRPPTAARAPSNPHTAKKPYGAAPDVEYQHQHREPSGPLAKDTHRFRCDPHQSHIGESFANPPIDRTTDRERGVPAETSKPSRDSRRDQRDHRASGENNRPPEPHDHHTHHRDPGAVMSSSLARTRSLRKPTQGSSTDLPPTTTTTSVSSSSSITAARGLTSSTTAGAAAAPSAPASTSHRPVSPSRLPAPRSLAATRPTTRTVSGASVASSTAAAAAATTASEAPKKKRPNPLSSLLSRSSSTRQPASATTSTSTRQRDVAAGAGAGGGGPAGSGPASAPLGRTSALSGLARTSSTREPGPTRTRYPANASTSSLSLVSSSNAATARTGAGSGPSTPTTARPTTSGGLPSSRRAGAPTTTSTGAAATAAGAGSPTKGHARARSVATLNNSTVLRPPSQTSSTGAAGAAPRSRPTSLYGAPPTSSYPSSTASTTTRPRPPSATDRLSSKPSVSSLSSATTTTSTRTARAGSTTTAPARQPLKQPHKPPSSQSQQASQPPHLAARQQAQQRHPSPTSPPRTTKPALRPAFSTLQQHYSPAKSLAPKPLTATYLAAPSPSKLPANIALTAETARLQTELLQLHLLHRDLPQVTSQWHASARSQLAARHADLAASARSLATLESDAAERRNLAALHSWGASAGKSGKAVTSSLPLEDRIQRLDALLTSLWSLDSPGGKYHRLVRAFERWAATLADLEAARARAEDAADPSALLDDNADVRFGGGLDARWKDDAAALVRRLEGWDAQLRELEYSGDDDEDVAAGTGTTTQASSLKRMLDGCSSLVRDMLDELAVMEDIEAATVERENEWIKKMNREGDDGRGRDAQRAGAIWRVI
ncbi:hypothetical protein CSIM01_07774 [Colletotrichum simmondsii]|uniref:Uncharacterized protein n=1 Tax=Colletotrichum simmondsii TaxID=703756 RepID=A0A135SV15_9PEZI|nr:hypothetical protein CSIM01_07774 [Colletotrichum simmondsii]